MATARNGVRSVERDNVGRESEMQVRNSQSFLFLGYSG